MTQTATATRPNPVVVDPPPAGSLALRERGTPGTGLALVPTTLTEAMQLAELLAKSSIVPKDFQQKPGDVFVAMQYGMEVGLAPLQAIQSIAVINGRPCMWGDAVLGLVRNSGLLEWIEEEIVATDGAPLETVYAVCRVKRKGMEKPREQRFSWRDAVRAGLDQKPLYKQYPQRMLAARARSWVLRDEFGDVLRGLAIREEVEDYSIEGTATASERVEPTPETNGLMPKRKSDAEKVSVVVTDDPAVAVAAAAASSPTSTVIVNGNPVGGAGTEPEVAEAVSDEDDYLAAQLGLDATATVLAEETSPPDPDKERREALLAEIDTLVADTKMKAAFLAAQWEQRVGEDRAVAAPAKLERLLAALKDAVEKARKKAAPPPASAAAPAATPPPAKEVRFKIGPTEYVTAGITKEQILKCFRLGDAVNKKAGGSDLAAAILKKEFSCVSRTELTEEQAERYLIRLTEVAESR